MKENPNLYNSPQTNNNPKIISLNKRIISGDENNSMTHQSYSPIMTLQTNSKIEILTPSPRIRKRRDLIKVEIGKRSNCESKVQSDNENNF